ncbi:OPT/YSL family transporter, partial [Streptomyces sp. NPDC060198]|uniref:OPT/YSL family transporter n=1 Tax=Streptomyces sp. NPDC060198 TaxID=3347070 RepID=UPI0036464E34
MAHHVSTQHTAQPPGPGPRTGNGVGADEIRSHPRVMEPALLVILVVLSAVGAVIGIDLVSKLGISANTSVVGALVAMLIGRIPLGFLRRMRSVHRQNLAQSAISAATFASANALLTSVAVPYAFGHKDLVWPMLAGSFVGLVVDAWVLYRAFGSRLLPADAAWPPGTAAAETIKAGDRGGRRALVLAGGTVVGLAGTLFSLPLSAAGVAFLGNVWALLMFGIGLMLRQYSPDLFDTDLGAGYIPHGVMVGAGIVALGQAVHLLLGRRARGQRASREAPAAPAASTQAPPQDPSTAPTVDERALRLSLVRGYALFTGGAALLAVLGGLVGDMSPLGIVGWVL